MIYMPSSIFKKQKLAKVEDAFIKVQWLNFVMASTRPSDGFTCPPKLNGGSPFHDFNPTPPREKRKNSSPKESPYVKESWLAVSNVEGSINNLHEQFQPKADPWFFQVWVFLIIYIWGIVEKSDLGFCNHVQTMGGLAHRKRFSLWFFVFDRPQIWLSPFFNFCLFTSRQKL